MKELQESWPQIRFFLDLALLGLMGYVSLQIKNAVLQLKIDISEKYATKAELEKVEARVTVPRAAGFTATAATATIPIVRAEPR